MKLSESTVSVLIVCSKLLLCLMLCLCLPQMADGDDRLNFTSSAPSWLSGRAVLQSMEEVSSLSGQGMTVGMHLSGWQAASRIRVILDRRIDPNQVVQVESVSGNRARILDQLAAALPGSQWVLVDDVVYFGPTVSSLRLPVLMELQKQSMAEIRRKSGGRIESTLNVRRKVNWKRLATPRDIIKTLAADAGLLVDNPQKIPHDLWDTVQWPALTFGEQATLILNQFNLMIRPTPDAADRVSVVEIDDSLVAEFAYNFESAGGEMADRDAINAAAEKNVPAAKIRWARGNARVTCSLSDHLWFQQQWCRLRFGGATEGGLTESLSTRRFTLTVEHATLGDVLASFAQNGIQIQVVDSDADKLQEARQRMITIKATTLPGKQFFSAVFSEHFESVQVMDDRVVLSGVR